MRKSNPVYGNAKSSTTQDICLRASQYDVVEYWDTAFPSFRHLGNGQTQSNDAVQDKMDHAILVVDLVWLGVTGPPGYTRSMPLGLPRIYPGFERRILN